MRRPRGYASGPDSPQPPKPPSCSGPGAEPSLGWDVIPGQQLLDSLRRCASGEDPDAVYAELWANAAHEDVR